MDITINWIKFDLTRKQVKTLLKAWEARLLYVAVHDKSTGEKYVATDIWEGDQFEEYPTEWVEAFAEFRMPEYPSLK